MKILHLCLGNFFIDNYSYQENMLPKYHVKQGHVVTVIASPFTFDKSGKGTYLEAPCSYKDKNGFDVIRLAYRKPFAYNRIFRHYVGLKQELENVDPDIIFMHNACFGDTPIVRHYLKTHPKVQLFADSHTDYINSAKNWLSRHFLHPLIWRHYYKVVEPFMKKCYGVTPMRCRFLKEMYKMNPDIVEYLPLGVDDDDLPKNRTEVKNDVRNSLGIDNDSIVIFTGGKIDKLKNTHLLISAIKKLNMPQIHLIICGVLTAEMDYLKTEIEELSNIHYLGWCNNDKVINCMIASDISCFPGTHSTLWEQSVGIGLPIICKEWPEMRQVDRGGNCIFLKSDNTDEIYEAILKYVFSHAELNELRRHAKEVASFFYYSEIAKTAINK